jgi:NAD(P)-dependent dehydrogenase (short-subunit alcohol dehydrogenase family)
MSTTKETVLVTGASGHLGYEAVQWLLEHYDGPIIAANKTYGKTFRIC